MGPWSQRSRFISRVKPRHAVFRRVHRGLPSTATQRAQGRIKNEGLLTEGNQGNKGLGGSGKENISVSFPSVQVRCFHPGPCRSFVCFAFFAVKISAFSEVSQHSLSVPINEFIPQRIQFTPKNQQFVPYSLSFCPIFFIVLPRILTL